MKMNLVEAKFYKNENDFVENDIKLKRILILN